MQSTSNMNQPYYYIKYEEWLFSQMQMTDGVTTLSYRSNKFKSTGAV